MGRIKQVQERKTKLQGKLQRCDAELKQLNDERLKMIAALQVPSPYVLGDGSLSNGMYQ
jgi:hypothetical protein